MFERQNLTNFIKTLLYGHSVLAFLFGNVEGFISSLTETVRIVTFGIDCDSEADSSESRVLEFGLLEIRADLLCSTHSLVDTGCGHDEHKFLAAPTAHE